uniref:Domain of unknown function DB domain-containing protein n=1 Tax=Plectus sambesii TaxID=2011161 RepID=A0A914WN62_9BILA
MSSKSPHALLALLLCFFCYKMFIGTEEMGRLQSKAIVSSSIEIMHAERMNAEKLLQHKLDNATKACCRKLPSIPTNCYDYCSFDALNTTSIVSLAMNYSPCHLTRDSISAIMSCMTFNHDHTSCCEELNIHKTEAGQKCIDFCKGNLEFGPLMDVTYFPCLEMMEQIMFCYKKHAIETL